MQRTQAGNERFDDREPDDREPDAGDEQLGRPERRRDDEDDALEDREHSVAHRPNPLPIREEEEEELSEADIMEELDMEELDADDLKQMDGPDA